MRRILLGLLLAITIVPTADAQFGLPFFKKKKKQPPPAEAVAKSGPAETPAPGAPPAAPKDSAGAPQQPGSAPAIAAPAGAAATVQGAGGQPALTAEETQILDTAIAQAVQADASPDTSIAHIKERIARWTGVLLKKSDNPIALNALQQAQADLRAANDRALQSGKADQDTRAVIASRLDQAAAAIQSKNWATAESHLQFVLERDRTNPRAKMMMPEVEHGRRIADLKRQAMYIMPVLLLLGVGMAFVIRFGAKHREDGQKKADELAAKRAAVLQIVDGVGRGKLVTLDSQKPIFKIGAATGAQEAEKNDLVVSDSAAMISRFHCTLVRKGGDYFLVDSSMNGTAINGRTLKRGDDQRLEDGDEITLAEVSRLKFLHT